jgi:LysR family transcriptional regulator of gallate degradation
MTTGTPLFDGIDAINQTLPAGLHAKVCMNHSFCLRTPFQGLPGFPVLLRARTLAHLLPLQVSKTGRESGFSLQESAILLSFGRGRVTVQENFLIPNLRHLRVFESVARLNSISRASSSLNLSQPAISHAVASLESRFGAKLLERNRSGSFPTEYGNILLFRIRRMHHLMAQAIDEFLAETSNGPRLDVNTTAARLTLTQIRSLIAVSENLSFDHAARSIDVSEPSVHRAARDLENLLRRPLYVRASRGVTTTKPGSVLAMRLNVALAEIRYAIEEINHGKGILNSSVMVGTLSTSGAALLSGAIDKLISTYPGVSVNVIEAPYEHLLQDLLKGNIDFLFSVLRRPDWVKEIVEEVLYRDDYVVVCRPAHPLRKARSLNRRHFSGYAWVMPGPATPRRRAFQALFGNHPPGIDVITASRAITRALIAASDRLTMLTRHEAESEESVGSISVLPFDCKIPAPEYGVAKRMEWVPTSIHQELLDILRRLARRAATSR